MIETKIDFRHMDGTVHNEIDLSFHGTSVDRIHMLVGGNTYLMTAIEARNFARALNALAAAKDEIGN